MLGLGLGLAIEKGPLVPGWVLPGSSIDFNFAQSLYYGTSLSAGISLSRASSGYAQTSAGTLVNFGSNVARITDQGLLVEEARTNLALWSQAINTANWTTIGGVTALLNQDTAPDGTQTASQVTITAGSANSLFQTFTITPASVYTVSWWAKVGTVTDLKYSIFDVTNSANIVAPTNYFNSLSSSKYTRVSFTFTAPAGCTSVRFYLTRDTVSTGTFFVWGGQAELGSFPTSYIPTTTTSATRAADNVTAAGALLTAMGGSAASVLVIDGGLPSFANSPEYLGNGTSEILGYGSNRRAQSFQGSVALSPVNSTSVGSPNKAAASWSASGRSVVLNNGTVSTDATAMDSRASINIASDRGVASFINGYIQRLTVFNSRLPDATLKGLTQ